MDTSESSGTDQELTITKSYMTYAITWNPKPDESMDLSEQLNSCMSTLYLLKTSCTKVDIFPEVTLNGNIHFHMQAVMKNRANFYMKVLPAMKKKGFVVVKDKVDMGWYLYMIKDKDLMQKLLQTELPLTLAHLEAYIDRKFMIQLKPKKPVNDVTKYCIDSDDDN